MSPMRRWGVSREYSLQLNLAEDLDHLNPGPCIQSMIGLAMTILHFLRLVQPRTATTPVGLTECLETVDLNHFPQLQLLPYL